MDGQWVERVQGGDAGTITIMLDKNLNLAGESAITTAAVSGGGGGINLKVDNLVFVADSEITTSVQEGAGSGGDLTIEGPLFVVLNNGKVIAQAHEGKGGNIKIATDQFVSSHESQVDASSEKGIDGTVVISAPESDVSDPLVALPSRFKITEKLQSPCNTKLAENLSDFTIIHTEGTPNSADDLLSSGPLLKPLGESSRKNQAKKLTQNVWVHPFPNVALSTKCQSSLSLPVKTTSQKSSRLEKSRNKSTVIPEQLF